jgi:hypothetical protein
MNNPIKTKRKMRSPAAPSRSLEDAFRDVEQLYKTYGRAVMSRSEIASTLGVSAQSGPFAARIFTYKEFGLLVSGGDDAFKVADGFVSASKVSRGDAEFKRFCIDAIQKPSLFKELLSDFKHKLPPTKAIANRLEVQKAFNPQKAEITASVLEESLKFAGVLDESNNILPIRGSGLAAKPQTEEDDVSEEAGTESIPQKGNLKMEVPLGVGRKAFVSYPSDFSNADANKISAVLKALASS